MITWAGYQPRWAEFKQGRLQKNRLQTFPGRADTLYVLGIHVGQQLNRAKAAQQPVHCRPPAPLTLKSVWWRPQEFCSALPVRLDRSQCPALTSMGSDSSRSGDRRKEI